MINIVPTAFDRCVTFFAAAEAYGAHAVGRILGEDARPDHGGARAVVETSFEPRLVTRMRLAPANAHGHVRSRHLQVAC